jgi:hypothetical protein
VEKSGMEMSVMEGLPRTLELLLGVGSQPFAETGYTLSGPDD